MRKLISIIVVAIATLASTSAYARPHHYQHVRHARVQTGHTQRVQVAQAPTLPDLFKMPLFGDVADYGSKRQVAANVGKSRQMVTRNDRRLVMAVDPHEVRGIAPSSLSAGIVSSGSGESASRPGDCYGIAWCGCFMRHYKGIADRSLNLARNWASVGSPTSAHSGAIVVWRGHVGELRSEPVGGYALVYSGNNGSGNQATVRRAYVGNAIAFRQL